MQLTTQRINTKKQYATIVHTEASLGWGGQEIRILTETAGMIARGHRVTLLCPKESKIFIEAQLRGIPVEAIPIGRKNLKGILALRCWLAANATDVVNTHSSTDAWLAAIAVLGMQDTPMLVRTRHISTPISNNVGTRWLYLKATQRIVTTGENLRNQLIAKNGYPEQHIISVPTGIDTNHFSPGDRLEARAALGLSAKATIIGIVATLRSWKGHRYLLEAFSRLHGRGEDLHLLIVGDGPYRQLVENLVRDFGLTGRVTMPGNQRDVVPWLRAMDIFVLPSYANEGVPQAILQAGACSLPILSTSVGGISEAVEHEHTGLLVEPKNAQALKTALARLLANPALRLRMGEAAMYKVRHQFGIETMLNRMETVFLPSRISHLQKT